MTRDLRMMVSQMSAFNVWGKTAVELWHVFEDLAEESKKWEEPTSEVIKSSTPNENRHRKGAYQIDDFEKM